MPYISTSVSSKVFYRKMGSGLAVILLHGFPESGTLWQDIWDDLAKGYTLIIPDFPGSGNSVLEKETSIADMAECVKMIMEAESINAAVIAGHSMGGYVAFAFADLYPQKVTGLSLIHSVPDADDDEKIKMRSKAIELIRKGSKEAFISQMVPNLFSASYKQSNSLKINEQISEALMIGEDGLVNFYKAMIARKDNTHVLAKAAYPIQWIVGADDNVIHFKKILDRCHTSAINFVSFYHNCGHMSMIEVPGKLAMDIRSFVNYSYFHNNKP